MQFNFWYTDLTEDAGYSWYSIHLYAGVLSNGNPRYEIDLTTNSLRFWKPRLLFALCIRLLNLESQQ